MSLLLPFPRDRSAVARRRASMLRLRPSFDGLEDRAVPASLAPHQVEGGHALLVAETARAKPQHLTADELATRRAEHAAALKAAKATKHARVTKAHGKTSSTTGSAASSTTGGSTASTTTAAAATPATPTVSALTSTTTTTTPASSEVLNLNIKPLDLNLLGLEVKLYGADANSPVNVAITAQPGSGNLLGNLLGDVSGLLNTAGVNNTLNTVLGNVIDLVNQSSLKVTGVANPSGVITSTTPVLDAYVAPIHLNLLGALVDTSPIHLQIIANAGRGLVLGNILTDLANLLNVPPANGKLTLQYVENRLQVLLNELNAQLPNIPSAPTTPVTPPAGTDRILSLNLPPINLNLLGLVLQTSNIQVNADAQAGNGELLGNLLVDVLNTLNASQQDLDNVNNELNQLLAKVVGVLNATSLTLPSNAVSSLDPTLQQLADPTLIAPAGSVTTPEPVLNLVIDSNNSMPPIDVNLLGVVVTTSNIQVQLLAEPGQDAILGNLVYNVSHLLDPGGNLNVLSILDSLGI